MITPIPFNIDNLIKEKEEQIQKSEKEFKNLPNEAINELNSDLHSLEMIHLKQELAAFTALKEIMNTINSIKPYGE